MPFAGFQWIPQYASRFQSELGGRLTFNLPYPDQMSANHTHHHSPLFKYYNLDVTLKAQDIYDTILLQTMEVPAVLMKSVICFTTFPNLSALNQGHVAFLWLPYFYPSVDKSNVYSQKQALRSSLFFCCEIQECADGADIRCVLGRGEEGFLALVLWMFWVTQVILSMGDGSLSCAL